MPKYSNLFNFLVLVFIVIFCSLGTWQLYRLDWKQNLILEIEQGLNENPVLFNSTAIQDYKKVFLEGKYFFDKQIYLYALNDSGQPGYEVLTPFKTNIGFHVLINRGWIPNNLKNSTEINLDLNSNYKLTGILKKHSIKNPFKPKNDINNNIWFYLDKGETSSFTKFELPDFSIILSSKQQPSPPYLKKITSDLPNNHLSYAITWYLISIAIMIFFLYFRKR